MFRMPLSLSRWLILLCVVGLCIPVFGASAITSVHEIRELSPEQADEALPVEVSGQVLWANLTNGHFFLYSEELGIFVHREDFDESGSNAVVAGDYVQISGVTNAGDYIPCIIASQVVVEGSGPLPEAPTIRSIDIIATKNDCAWYRLAGRIESMQVFPDEPRGGSIVLQVNVQNVVVSVILPLVDGAVEQAQELMFSRIRFQAVAGSQFTSNRQFVGRIFFLNSLSDCEVIDGWTPGVKKGYREIHELGRSEHNFRAILITGGQVTHIGEDYLILRGEKACLKATIRGNPDVRLGDTVKVQGVVVPDRVSPGFLAREIISVEHGEVPEPVLMELDEELSHHWGALRDVSLNHELVRIEAELLEVAESLGGEVGEREHVLICRQGNYVFSVKLPYSTELSESLEAGAILQIDGICHLTRNEARTWRLSIDWFWIEPRSAADLKVLVPAPWWTATRLLWLVGAILGVALLIVIWNVSLHRTVDRQTAVIAEKVERESIDEERQRIARDLHDTLEQSLAALGMLLRITKTQISSVSVKGAETLSKAIGMHRSCTEQSRSAIVELREGDERVSLASRLSKFVDEMGVSDKGYVRLELQGEEQTLQRLVSYYAYRICVEAVTNALNHAVPDEVVIHVIYALNKIQISVTDDGCGFDPDTLSSSDRFGIIGMRERAKKINAEFSVESRIGEGTTLTLSVPI